MLSRVKNKIKRKSHEIIDDLDILGYQKEVERQKNPYGQWIKANEKKKTKNYLRKFPKIRVIDYQNCDENFNLQHIECDYIIFKNDQGKLAQNAKNAVFDAFLSSETAMLYGDEDVMDSPLMEAEIVDSDVKGLKVLKSEIVESNVMDSKVKGSKILKSIIIESDKRGQVGRRSNPWFKPGWSPNTLLSFFYFGNIFAVRTNKVSHILWKQDKDYRVNLYDFVLKVSEIYGQKPIHVDGILFHNYLEKNREFPHFWGDSSEFLKIKKEAELRRGYPQEEEKGLVSIIIPSKDNPNLLDQCLSSIIAKTNYTNYEILVIDNGSSEDNRLRITGLQHRYEFTYLFESMEFNFSKMCNIGANEARGDFFLFLNDDIEVKEGDWLTKMVGKARLPHIGAVGAKLLYPESNRIQHIGITNLEVGPAHKLVGLLDENIYYYGQNRFQYDMIGVTAACLLIESEKYHRLGGFLEDLKVAYNDVEFCFRLLDFGYYNLQCNDVVLYHHESFSRGDDRENMQSYRRLLEDKNKLYGYHPNYKNYDPFYSKHLTGNSPLYDCNYLYEYQKREKKAVFKTFKGEVLNNFLVEEMKVTIDFAGIEPQLDILDSKGYLIEGWSYIRANPNDYFRRWIILEQEGRLPIQVSLLNRYRYDVIAILPEEIRVDLAGFVARIPNDKLEAGEYKVGILAKNLVSRKKFYVRTETIFTVVKAL